MIIDVMIDYDTDCFCKHFVVSNLSTAFTTWVAGLGSAFGRGVFPKVPAPLLVLPPYLQQSSLSSPTSKQQATDERRNLCGQFLHERLLLLVWVKRQILCYGQFGVVSMNFCPSMKLCITQWYCCRIWYLAPAPGGRGRPCCSPVVRIHSNIKFRVLLVHPRSASSG